jgi:uncharacterized membrane protein
VKTRFPVVGATVAAAVLFCAGILAAPLLEAGGHAAGSWLRWLYGPLCHQLARRSLELAGHPLTVCARCTGLYLGGLLGLVVSVAAGWGGRVPAPRRSWLIVAVLPTALDFLVKGLGNGPRLGVALPAGVALGVFLGIGLNDLGRMMRPDRPSQEERKRWMRASPTC